MELRILVLEDQEDSAYMMSLLLQCWGYDPTVVYNGKRALEVAKSLCPHVAFLDIGLPDMDGCEVARQMRGMPETSKVFLVAITGYGREEDIRRCKEAGIDFHLLKPVKPEIIKEVLEFTARMSCDDGETTG